MGALPAISHLAAPVEGRQRVGVYGATGRLGRLTAPLLTRSSAVAVAGRTESRVAELFAQPWCGDAMTFSPSQRSLLCDFVKPCRAVVNCAGPLVSAELAWAAIEAGADFIDSSDGVLWPESSRCRIHCFARERAVAVVPCVGLDRLLLDLYAAVVARQAGLASVDVRAESGREGVAIRTLDRNGLPLRNTALPDTTPHVVTAHVIAEAVRCVLDDDILASGILDWRAIVPELFLEAMPFEELRAVVHHGFGMALPEDLMF